MPNMWTWSQSTKSPVAAEEHCRGLARDPAWLSQLEAVAERGIFATGKQRQKHRALPEERKVGRWEVIFGSVNS